MCHAIDRRKVDRGIFADRGVGAAPGLDAGDALGRQRAGAFSWTERRGKISRPWGTLPMPARARS
jgi:hypothetical protein